MRTPRTPPFSVPKPACTEAGTMLRARGTQTLGQDYAAIEGLLEGLSAACDVDRASPTSHTKQAIRAIQNELRIARAAADSAFADQHGWELAKTGFTLDELRNGHHRMRWTDDLWPIGYPVNPIDHSEYYRFSWGSHFPAAIVSHEYGAFEDSEAFATANGLIATRLPASWYNPARATAVVYTSPLIHFPPVR